MTLLMSPFRHVDHVTTINAHWRSRFWALRHHSNKVVNRDPHVVYTDDIQKHPGAEHTGRLNGRSRPWLTLKGRQPTYPGPACVRPGYQSY